MTPIKFARFLLFLALAFGLAGAAADADLWGHVRFGQELLASHRVVAADTHSFTSDRPWVNHEWLAEVTMASAFAAAGPPGLNVLRIACLAIIAVLIWRRLAPFKPPASVLDALVVVAMLGVYARAQHVRPQMFSLLFFAVLLTILTTVDRTRDRRALWLIPPLVALWANVHGGWLVGVECLAAWVGCKLLFDRATFPSGRERLMLIALVVTAAGATTLNPYGVGMWRFLLDTVRVGRPYIEDWQPVYRLPVWAWIFWLLPATLTVVAAVRARWQMDPTNAVVVCLLAVGSLMVNRLDAFFTLAVVFLMAEPLAGHWRPRAAESTRRRSIAALRPALAILALGAVPLFAIRAARIEVGHPPMPEREAAEFVARSGIHGRVLMWFDWGEYVIWHFSPQLRVSMDGRRETVYSDRVIDDHMQFYLGEAKALDLPARIAADYIWVPRWLPVVVKLRDRGWMPIFEGPESVILAPNGSSVGQLRVAASNSAERPFPQ